MSYVIYADSGSDVPQAVLKEWNVYSSNLHFHFDNDETLYEDGAMPAAEFFRRMEEGHVAKTSAVNVGAFLEAFEKLLQQGLDILYVGFGSRLSATYNSGAMAAQQLMEKYPERKILTVDTCGASCGHGLAVYEAVQKKKAGATLEEAYAHAQEVSGKIRQWITVEDLEYLKRGGRISPTTALVGKALGIKPLIYVNAEGVLHSVDKARGKKKALKAMVEEYGKHAAQPGSPVFITHGNCLKDAQLLADMLEKKYGTKTLLINDFGSVVGAHIGPGGIYFAYMGKAR